MDHGFRFSDPVGLDTQIQRRGLLGLVYLVCIFDVRCWPISTVRVAATLCLKLREERMQRGRRVSVAIDPTATWRAVAFGENAANRRPVSCKGPDHPIRRDNSSDQSDGCLDYTFVGQSKRPRALTTPRRDLPTAFHRPRSHGSLSSSFSRVDIRFPTTSETLRHRELF